MIKYILILVLIISSCTLTRNAAHKKLDRIQREQPIVITEKCASLYQPIDSVITSIIYKEGETIYSTDTFKVQVNCDSILKKDPKIKYVSVPCPPNKSRIDTVIIDTSKVISNKFKEDLLQFQKDSLINTVIISQEKIKNKNKHISLLGGILLIALVLFIIRLYLKTKIL